MITDLSDEEIDHLLKTETVGVLSLADKSESYSIPQTFGYDGKFIYFQFVSSENSKKEEFVNNSEVVSFVVFNEDPPESVVIRGEIQSTEMTENITNAMIENAEYPAFNVYPDKSEEELTFNYYVLKPYRITGKSFENIF